METRNTRKGIIQIAGIIDRKEAEMLLRLGVDWLGFPFELPVHQEDLTRGEAAEIIRSLDCSDRSVLITYLDLAREIVTLCAELGTQRTQLHGDISLEEMKKLRDLSPDLFVIKTLIVSESNLTALESQVLGFSPWVDAFLTDTYDPVTKATGATGKAHDWEVSRQLVNISPRPVLLAGGLNPQNVQQAIWKVCPAGVDAHTGVENRSGRKDQRKVKDFVSKARKAWNSRKRKD